MKLMNTEQVNRFNTLMSRTESFMHFFDQAEINMGQWQQGITELTMHQQEQINTLSANLIKIESLISDSGLEGFRAVAEDTLLHTEAYVQRLKNTEEQLLRQIHGHRAELTRITQHAITQITHKSTQLMNSLDDKLSRQEYNPLENIIPSYIHDEPGLHQTPEITNTQPIKYVECRLITLTLLTSLITALVIGLYTNDEYPWEMHQQAMNERGAGRVLLNAWPLLSHQEKNKILYRAL